MHGFCLRVSTSVYRILISASSRCWYCLTILEYRDTWSSPCCFKQTRTSIHATDPPRLYTSDEASFDLDHLYSHHQQDANIGQLACELDPDRTTRYRHLEQGSVVKADAIITEARHKRAQPVILSSPVEFTTHFVKAQTIPNIDNPNRATGEKFGDVVRNNIPVISVSQTDR